MHTTVKAGMEWKERYRRDEVNMDAEIRLHRRLLCV